MHKQLCLMHWARRGVCKTMDPKRIKVAIIQARTKDLTVRKNSQAIGWCVMLPNGSTYNAKTDQDMVEYVKGY